MFILGPTLAICLYGDEKGPRNTERAAKAICFSYGEWMKLVTDSCDQIFVVRLKILVSVATSFHL